MEVPNDVVDVVLTPQSLGAVDVVALVMWNRSASELNALSAIVRDGGGLLRHGARPGPEGRILMGTIGSLRIEVTALPERRRANRDLGRLEKDK